jgi:hypothetical protein
MTTEELLALLNQSTDNILSDANRLNLTANKMGNTIDNILPNYGIMGTDQANMFGGDIDDEYVPMPEEDSKEESGIAKLLQYLPFIGEKSFSGEFLRNLLPKQDPRAINMRNFYGSQYGLTPSGSVASGIMAGYNPISGGLFGTPVNYGLADAARRRIEKIANRKAAQTDASRARIAELQRFAEADTISRARQAAPDVYRDAGREDRLGPGGGFSTSGREGAFSSKSGRGRQDF